MAELAGTRAVRLGAECDVCYQGLLMLILAVPVRADLPRKEASSFAVVLRGDPSWRPIGVVSLLASALFVVFRFLPGLRRSLYA